MHGAFSRRDTEQAVQKYGAVSIAGEKCAGRKRSAVSYAPHESRLTARKYVAVNILINILVDLANLRAYYSVMVTNSNKYMRVIIAHGRSGRRVLE